MCVCVCVCVCGCVCVCVCVCVSFRSVAAESSLDIPDVKGQLLPSTPHPPCQVGNCHQITGNSKKLAYIDGLQMWSVAAKAMNKQTYNNINNQVDATITIY